MNTPETVDFEALAAVDGRIFKAGNSLAIRLPSAIAKRLLVEDGSEVEMAVQSGILHVRKARSRKLADLIQQITPKNSHGPMFDTIAGAEHW